MHTVLCGHTGSSNRGCEAIVRSTIDLLARQQMKADIATFNIYEDIAAGLDSCGKLISYRDYQGKMSIQRLYNGAMKKIFRNEFPYERFRQKDVFAAVKKAGSAVVIGGDTYCYSHEVRLPAYNLNRFVHKMNGKCLLWSCSVQLSPNDKEILADLNRYDLIFPREQLTYRNLVEVGIPNEKLFQMSDSAFVLRSQAIELPEGFDNVLAYNPSYTLGKNKNQDVLYAARIEFLKYVLRNTDMKIALIPHVFKRDFGDLKICKEIASILNDDRVFVIDGDYNCQQLKYAISKCRFLVAERTHASIAGYSQCVPTFVVGYSVKSEGIATDLFGTTQGYVIPSHTVTQANDLMEPLVRFLDMEEKVKNQLKQRIPAYIHSAEKGGQKLCEVVCGE